MGQRYAVGTFDQGGSMTQASQFLSIGVLCPKCQEQVRKWTIVSRKPGSITKRQIAGGQGTLRVRYKCDQGDEWTELIRR